MKHGLPKYRDRLRLARRRLGISQQEMAALLLTPQSTYEQWEFGRYRVPGAAVIAAELLCELDLDRAPTLEDIAPRSDELASATSLTRPDSAKPATEGSRSVVGAAT